MDRSCRPDPSEKVQESCTFPETTVTVSIVLPLSVRWRDFALLDDQLAIRPNGNSTRHAFAVGVLNLNGTPAAIDRDR